MLVWDIIVRFISEGVHGETVIYLIKIEYRSSVKAIK